MNLNIVKTTSLQDPNDEEGGTKQFGPTKIECLSTSEVELEHREDNVVTGSVQ